jgi:Tfp pilus assembly protein FimT
MSMRERTAMTLLELMLVVTIMVVVAALSIPAIQRTFARQALDKGADRVRDAMGQARIKAIRNGEEYAVYILPGGSYVGVAPLSQFQEQACRASQRNQNANQVLNSNLEDDLLPRGVIFVGSDIGQDSRSASVSADPGAGNGGVMPILFYPDGTSQDAVVIVENEKRNRLEVQLRGLTGTAKKVKSVSGRGQ